MDQATEQERTFTVCVSKEDFEQNKGGFKGEPAGDGPCAKCGTIVVWRSPESIKGEAICSDCFVELVGNNIGRAKVMPSDGAIAELGEEKANSMARLAMLATVVERLKQCSAPDEESAVRHAMAADNATEATMRMCAAPLAAPDRPQPGSVEMSAFIAGVAAGVSCFLAAMKAEHQRGRLQGVDIAVMNSMLHIIVEVDAAIAKAYGVDANGQAVD